MTVTTALIRTSRAFPYPVAAIYAHWTSPETRQRWEAGPESGMRYDAFDTRPGATEIVRITHDGQEIGHLAQTVQAMTENERMAVQITGTFGGAMTMLMQLVLHFSATDDGSRIDATAQVIDLTGRDIQAEHEAGWSGLFDSFEADIATHGLIEGEPKT